MFPDILDSRLAGILAVDARVKAALSAHYELLVKWNGKMNLTAIRSMDEAVERHYCESLFLGARLPAGPLRVVDLGSGPGFPGFPVAVLRPDCQVTLVESNQRKAVFLKESSRALANVRVLARRLEDVTEEFDWAISRAVSYEDLALGLKSIARNADLLTGEEAPPASLGFDWEPPTPLPWGQRRFIWRGRRSG